MNMIYLGNDLRRESVCWENLHSAAESFIAVYINKLKLSLAPVRLFTV